MPAIWAIIQPFVKPVIDAVSGFISTYGQIIAVYFKGRREQYQSDKIKTLEHVTKETAATNKELQDAQAQRQNEEFGKGPNDDDPNIRVQHPDARW